jgi:Ca2+-binding EF-hand superfamily protein
MLTLTLAAAALAPLALPQDKGGQGGGYRPPMRHLLANFSFDKLDGDKNETITKAEVTQATFAWLDRNDDKSLDRNELTRLPATKSPGQLARDQEKERKEKRDSEKEKKPEKKPEKKEGRTPESKPADDAAKGDPAKEHLERMDANKDGKVSQAEFQLPEGWFAQVDADGDGNISKDEFLGKSQRSGNRLRDLLDKSPEDAFAELDADRDGKLTEKELGLPAKAFERTDKDGDGSVSKSELADALERMRKGGDRKDGEKKGEKEKPEPPGERPPG